MGGLVWGRGRGGKWGPNPGVVAAWRFVGCSRKVWHQQVVVVIAHALRATLKPDTATAPPPLLLLCHLPATHSQGPHHVDCGAAGGAVVCSDRLPCAGAGVACAAGGDGAAGGALLPAVCLLRSPHRVLKPARQEEGAAPGGCVSGAVCAAGGVACSQASGVQQALLVYGSVVDPRRCRPGGASICDPDPFVILSTPTHSCTVHTA